MTARARAKVHFGELKVTKAELMEEHSEVKKKMRRLERQRQEEVLRLPLPSLPSLPSLPCPLSPQQTKLSTQDTSDPHEQDDIMTRT